MGTGVAAVLGGISFSVSRSALAGWWSVEVKRGTQSGTDRQELTAQTAREWGAALTKGTGSRHCAPAHNGAGEMTVGEGPLNKGDIGVHSHPLPPHPPPN
ncbi:hypothetical protein NHX12_005187 [Muraenolepis orangiensis]|uniref:Uncharacterized protein n=1 Tax=Muraenolepis orangiensis TaxID=630683 RepID=A0A9Q0DNX2_9TELE|nr:hypothetical protein NHX12_005187 [Muraenolepis orangiensis]